jgi:hypothetical protein
MKKLLLYTLLTGVLMALAVPLYCYFACPDISVALPTESKPVFSTDTTYQLWQSNAAGDDIHIYNINSGQLTKRLVVGENPHGLALVQNDKVMIVSNEYDKAKNGELVWVDTESFQITNKVAVGIMPHEIEATRDGAYIYVPCADGYFWVVESATKKNVKKIYTGGRPHNTRISTDNRWMYLSPMGMPKHVYIVDIQNGHKVVDSIRFTESVRPPSLTKDNKRFFQQVNGLNGFEVADIESRKMTNRIHHKECIGCLNLSRKRGFWNFQGGFKRCHGLEIRPDQKEIWALCHDYLRIHDLNPPYKELYSFKMPAKGYWMCFSPDSRYACVALVDAGKTIVIDAFTKKIVRTFTVGKWPKRNLIRMIVK